MGLSTYGVDYKKPILYNFLRYTYTRLAEEDKIVVSDDGQYIAFNTGLVTHHQEAIFCLSNQNRFPNAEQPWHFQSWCRKGQNEMSRFSIRPEMAHYFDDPASLVLDFRKQIRVNVEHIIEENKERFPEPFRTMDNYTLQTFLSRPCLNQPIFDWQENETVSFRLPKKEVE